MGPLELIIVLVIALLVFGPGKLPDVGAALGKSIREFRKAASDVQEATSLTPAPPPVAPVAPVAPPVAAAPVEVVPAAPVPAAPAPAAPAPAPAAGPAAGESTDATPSA